MHISDRVPSSRLKLISGAFFKSGYFWGSIFILAFGVYNLISLWVAIYRHGALSGFIPEELLVFASLFLGAGLWFFFDLYQIQMKIEYTKGETKREVLKDSAYRTARMFYVAAVLAIFALLVCRMMVAHL